MYWGHWCGHTRSGVHKSGSILVKHFPLELTRVMIDDTLKILR